MQARLPRLYRLHTHLRTPLLGLFVLLMPTTVLAGAAVYPAPQGVASDPEYQVTVDGKPVFVWNNPVAGLASFEMTGTVTVEITARRDVKWVDVRPLSRGVQPRIEGGKIRLTLNKAGNYTVELNGEITRHPLFLFANPPEEAPPQPGPGVHFFAAGQVHKPGLIEVKSGETVYIAGGAVVEGSIVGKGVTDVKIRGRGLLDGTNLRSLLGDKKMRPHFISLRDCKNVEVEGVVLSNGQTWQFVPVNCENLRVKNIKIVSDNGGDDGIDVVRSRHVQISESFFHTKDDNIVVKAIHDYPADVTSHDIEAWNNVYWNALWGNALEIGFELRSERVYNIVFRDSDVIHVEDGAVFSIHNADGALVENVVYRNIRVEDATQKLFDFAIFLSQYSVDRPESKEDRDARYMHGAWDGVLTVPPSEMNKHRPHRGKIRNVVIDNVSVVAGRLPFSLAVGFDAEHDVQGVVIKRLTYQGKPLRTLRDARFMTEHATVRFK